MQHANIDRGWLPSVIYSPFYDITVNPLCVSEKHTRGFALGACSRLILHGQYTRGFILRGLALCYGTREGANERNLVWDSWYSPGEGLGTSSKLNMATSLWSRSKQKKLILLMTIMRMMIEDDSSVSNRKSLPGKHGLACGFWEDRRKGLFVLVFENCPWKIQTDFVNTWELHTQNSSSSTSTLLVDAMLIFEHESRVPKELWKKILANLIGWCFTFAVLIHAQQKVSVHSRERFQVRSFCRGSLLPNI